MLTNVYESDNKELFEQMRKGDAKNGGYVIEHYWFHQFAEGCTGSSHSRDFILNEDKQVFTSYKAACEYKKAHGMKNFDKKGRGNEGYGDVGAESEHYKVVKVADAIKEYDKNRMSTYFSWTFAYIKK